MSQDLLYLKQLLDEVAKKMRAKVGLVIVCEGMQGHMPFQELILKKGSAQWRQFRKRMSTSERPWCHIASLSAEEVKVVLAGYEQGVLNERFPDLRLTMWSSRIHTHLTHSFFDTDPGERVTMQNVRNVVDGIIRRLAARHLSDIPGAALIDEVVAAMLASPETKVLVRDPGSASPDGESGSSAKVTVI
jgi:DNA primase